MGKKTNIDALNSHMFEVIEMLKNNNDPNASENEKMDIETAKAISDAAKIIVDGYKVQAQVLGIVSKTENPKMIENLLTGSGLMLPEKQDQ